MYHSIRGPLARGTKTYPRPPNNTKLKYTAQRGTSKIDRGLEKQRTIMEFEQGTRCCVQDKRRETKPLYALAAVRAKRTQQSPRACPNGHGQTQAPYHGHVP